MVGSGRVWLGRVGPAGSSRIKVLHMITIFLYRGLSPKINTTRDTRSYELLYVTAEEGSRFRATFRFAHRRTQLAPESYVCR